MTIPVQTHIIARNIRRGDVILEVNGHPYRYSMPVSGVTTVATSPDVYVRHATPDGGTHIHTMHRNAHVTVALEPRAGTGAIQRLCTTHARLHGGRPALLVDPSGCEVCARRARA